MLVRAAACLLLLLLAGCLFTDRGNSPQKATSSANPADYPGSTVPGVVKTIGQEGPAPGQFVLPESIAKDGAGNFYVVDSFNDRIQKLDPFGNYILSWGSSGSGEGQFLGCRGLAVDLNDQVYVTDVILHRVQKFDSSGNFITKWGSEGAGAGQFSAPFDIATDSLNNVYVVDTNNNRVQKFDPSGTLLSEFGTKGTGDGQFGRPIGIVIDSEDNIYVAEEENNRVQKFDKTMSFVGRWGQAGTGDGEFLTPYGLAADAGGNIYVTDIGNNRIQKFDSGGNYLGKAGQAGYREGEFAEPSDIITDGFGNLYVVDDSNHRVQLLTQAIFSSPSPAGGRDLLSAGQAFATAGWMKDMVSASGDKGSIPLTMLMLPGTHDTGTYGITTDSAMADDGNFNGPAVVTDTTGLLTNWCHKVSWTPHSLCKLLDDLTMPINNAGTEIMKSNQAPWSKSQDQNVLEQLNGGVRFLDLRVQAIDGFIGDGRFRVIHSMVSVPLTTVLNDIVNFYKQAESGREIVVVALKLYRMTARDHQDLANLIKSTLVNADNQSLLINRLNGQDLSTFTLTSLWTQPGRVFVFYPDGETVQQNPELWLKNGGDGNDPESTDSMLVNYWPQTKDSDELMKKVREHRSSFLSSCPDTYNRYFYVSQLVRTQDAEAVETGIEVNVFSLYSAKLNAVERYLFKKLWKYLRLPMPPLRDPTNLLDWGTETNNAVLGDFFQCAAGKNTNWDLKWNILIVDNYRSGFTNYIQQIISYNRTR